MLPTLPPGIYDKNNECIRLISEEQILRYDSFKTFLKDYGITQTELTVVIPKISDLRYNDGLTFFDFTPNVKIFDMRASKVSLVCRGCTDLEEVYLPNDLKQYFHQSFNLCPKLKTLHISKNNKYFETEDGILYNKGKTALLYCPPKSNFEINESVTTIVDYALYDCPFNEVVIPYGVKQLDVFSLMSSYTDKERTIFLPNTIELISGRFIMCNSKTTIYCSGDTYYKLSKECNENVTPRLFKLDTLLEDDPSLPMTKVNDYLKLNEDFDR